jgi:hypothetical protein
MSPDPFSPQTNLSHREAMVTLKLDEANRAILTRQADSARCPGYRDNQKRRSNVT